MQDIRYKVSIVKGKNAEEMITEAIELIGGVKSFVKTGERVLIKPNLCRPKRAETGTTTDPNVVRAIIDLLQEKTGDIAIIESDGAATDAEIIWSHCGFYDLAKEKNVSLINLSKEPSLTHEGYRLPKMLFGDYALINVPKVKTNDLTMLTCSLKNMFGLLPDRHRAKYHKHINQVIVDLNRIFKSRLIVADCLVGMEGNGPIAGKPVNMNIVIAGDNPVAVDSVVSNLIGINPERVDHIKMAADAGLGTMDMRFIDIFGEKLSDVRRTFALPSTISLKQKLEYKLLEHSDEIFLKQGVGVLGWMRRRKYSKSMKKQRRLP